MEALPFPAPQPPEEPAASTGAAISVRSLSKAFHLPHDRYSTVKERVLHPFASPPYELNEALHEVSFDVGRGEFFGVMGRNGSGKSTLLRCLSGIYRPDAGSASVTGRVAPFIDLGVGFNPDMTARDNAVINAVLLGLSRREAEARFEEIVAFAELEDFVDLRLRNYSSGMIVRLAFAVTVQVDADVLLFDEVLAVGDAAFRERCFARFEQLKAEGRTVVLVSHDSQSVERFCDRAMLLHGGAVVDIDEPGAIAERYRTLGRPPLRPAAGAVAPQPSPEPPPASPSLTRSGARRTLEVAWTLALAQFRLRYLEAKLSYVWTVLRPLTLFLVMYLIFTAVGRFDQGVERYPLYLLTALVLWTFFNESTSRAVGCLVKNRDLLRKLPVPRVAVPLSVVLSSLFDLCMNLVAVFVFIFAFGVAPRPSWLELPVLALVLSVLVLGMAMLLSPLYVRYRDLDQIWVVARQALFYLSPIFYVVAFLPDQFERLALSNPLASVFTQARTALIDPEAPSAAAAMGGAVWLLVPAAVVLGVFLAGVIVFTRSRLEIAEKL